MAATGVHISFEEVACSESGSPSHAVEPPETTYNPYYIHTPQVYSNDTPELHRKRTFSPSRFAMEEFEGLGMSNSR